MENYLINTNSDLTTFFAMSDLKDESLTWHFNKTVSGQVPDEKKMLL